MRLSINQKLNMPRPLISSHYYHSFNVFIVTFIFILFMSEGRAGETWGTSSNVKIVFPPN
jgi:hypothetical protein